MKSNKLLMKEALDSLKDKWGIAIVGLLIYSLISAAASSTGGFLWLIVGGPLSIGLCNFVLNISRNKKEDTNQLFDGFKKFEKGLIAYLLVSLYTFLWSLLLIIPGIIAAISYSQTFFILADNDTISGTEAMKKSQQMMQGKKWKYFCLGLRFIGWFLLAILTLGIGFIFLAPYVQVTLAKFYDDVK